jgi:hypothetical protein
MPERGSMTQTPGRTKAKRRDADGFVYINIPIPRDLRRDLKRVAIDGDITMEEGVRIAVASFVESRLGPSLGKGA